MLLPRGTFGYLAYALLSCSLVTLGVTSAAAEPHMRQHSLETTQAQTHAGVGTRPRTAALAHALGDGDTPKVAQLLRTLHASGRSRRLIYAQLGYNMPRLFKLAMRCRGRAYRKQQWVAAAQCGAFAVAAARIMGNAREMLRALVWAKQILLPAMAQHTHDKLPSLGVFGHVDLPTLVRSVPPLRSQLRTQPVSVQVLDRARVAAGKQGSHSTRREAGIRISIRINDRPAVASIDTGTPVPLIIGRSEAKRLGLRILVSGLTTLGMPSHGPQRGAAQLALVTRFRLGPLTLRNLIARVVPNQYVKSAGGTLVGLPVLARFKQVTFTGTHIILTAPPRYCAHPIPLAYTASPNQLGFLVFATTAVGKPVTVTFDTGSSALLRARPGFGHNRSARVSEQAAHRRHIGYLAIAVPGGHIASYGAVFGGTMRWPGHGVDVLLGAPLMKFAMVRLTFLPPSLCIIPKR